MAGQIIIFNLFENNFQAMKKGYEDIKG